MGWVIGPVYLVKQLALMKMRANLFTDGIHHLILADLLERGKLEDHLKRLSCQHTALRNLAVQSLREVHASSLVRFEVPQGGLYLWCGVPYHLDLSVAINRMEREGVSVAPGQLFTAMAEVSTISACALQPLQLNGWRAGRPSLPASCGARQPGTFYRNRSANRWSDTRIALAIIVNDG